MIQMLWFQFTDNINEKLNRWEFNLYKIMFVLVVVLGIVVAMLWEPPYWNKLVRAASSL